MSNNIKVSKTLSYLLRHGAEKEGIEMRNDGFVNINEILKHRSLKNSTNLNEIIQIAENCPKQRFKIEYFNNEPFIRANQGHSLQSVEIDMIKINHLENNDHEPKLFIHGTYYKALESIRHQGLSRMNRQHVHLSEDFPGSKSVISGMRQNCEIAIFVDAAKAMKDGLEFYRSSNNVILCTGDQNGFIKPEYFNKIVDLKTNLPLNM